MRTLIAIALLRFYTQVPHPLRRPLTTPFIMALLASPTMMPLERLPYTRKEPRTATQMGRM